MPLKEAIYKRRSVRKYTDNAISTEVLKKIREFCDSAKPLYPDIKVFWKILSKDQIKCILPWRSPQVIAIYSEDKAGCYENAGFLFQQVDLYLQSQGLGSCWLGMGKPNEKSAATGPEGMKFIIMLAFGQTQEPYRSTPEEFNRKSLSEISDREDPRLEPARLAPSAVNSQPWHFTHEGDTVHAFCETSLRLKALGIGTMNRVDMGIALAHQYVANPDTFCFFKEEKQRKGHDYIGSFTL